jgi:hypothetical protein
MDKVEEFINQEKTLKAMISIRKPQEPAPEKKKEPKKAGKEGPKPVKRFSDYNFTPINVRVAEVLVVINKDTDFRWASKITGTPSPRNKDKYCEYDEAIGHTTKVCIALRMLIEKFIVNGKLIRFVGEQRAQQAQDWLREQPRDHCPQNYEACKYPPRDK